MLSLFRHWNYNYSDIKISLLHFLSVIFLQVFVEMWQQSFFKCHTLAYFFFSPPLLFLLTPTSSLLGTCKFMWEETRNKKKPHWFRKDEKQRQETIGKVAKLVSESPFQVSWGCGITSKRHLHCWVAAASSCSCKVPSVGMYKRIPEL